MSFTLAQLPYPFDALEPAIDAKTMEIHWSKHHQTYINNANAALEGTPWASWSGEEIIKNLSKISSDKQTVLKNNVGGFLNHNLFWETLTHPQKSGKPLGPLAQGIEALGGYEKMKAELTKAALGRFGAGWAWLCVKPDKSLLITSTANQDNPLSEGLIPILGIDVWEHAYYLKYQNRRADYVEAFFSVIAWEKVAELYQAV